MCPPIIEFATTLNKSNFFYNINNKIFCSGYLRLEDVKHKKELTKAWLFVPVFHELRNYFCWRGDQ